MALSVNRPLSLRPLPSASRRVAVCVRAAGRKSDVQTFGKAQLAELVKSETGITKEQAIKAVDAVFHGISDALLKGQRVTLVGFGAFEARERKERKGRNPTTGLEMVIPAQTTAGFKVSPILKGALNGEPPKPKAAASPATPQPAVPKPAAPKPAAAAKKAPAAAPKPPPKK